MNTSNGIRFTYPHDGVLARSIRSLHHRDLVLDFLLPAVRDQERFAGEQESPEERHIWSELEGAYARWAENEVLRFGIVSFYHLWERQVRSLFEDQIPEAWNRACKEKGKPFTRQVRTVLRDALGSDLDEQTWDDLDAGRDLANAVKHRSGDATDEGWIAVAREEVQAFADAVERFWTTFPYELDHGTGTAPLADIR